jgi:hypothetical protein
MAQAAGAESRRVEIRWRGGRSMALPGYAAAFAVVLLVLSLQHGEFRSIHRSLMAFGVLPLSYLVAAFVFNSTVLSREGDDLRIAHGPLPWRRPVVLPLSEVKRLRFERDSARLMLRTRQGEDVTLLDDMKREQADVLDRELRKLVDMRGESAPSDSAEGKA